MKKIPTLLSTIQSSEICCLRGLLAGGGQGEGMMSLCPRESQVEVPAKDEYGKLGEEQKDHSWENSMCKGSEIHTKLCG